MTDPEGTPLAVIISAANRHDVNFLLPLVFLNFPRVKGQPGRPRELPRTVRADCGYTSRDLLALLSICGIDPRIPQRGDPPVPGLGKHRWPVERTISWLKQYRRVGVRRERRATHYETFVTLACALIVYKRIAL